ncbi:hypothetical protein [Kitasatospora purpeofusca]|uniref:hypothetical protein n=1 Tax=Kitasatospora purpeofusca TaxID=67352 RepID=UPI0036D3F117
MTDNDSLLIVPVDVDALAVTDAVRRRGGKDNGFRRWAPEYKLLHYNATPEPQPFSNDRAWNAKDSTQYLDNGVVVRWQVPAGLRHGRPRTQGGRTEFPLVPNRWLVVRRIGSDHAKAAAWVVESDYLDSHTGASPFVHPVKPGITEPDKTPYRSTVTTTRIGQATDIGPGGHAWSEPADDNRKELFLTAVGPGLMTFHVFEPYHRNVFSLYDPLTGIDTATVDYQVIGWYSDPAQEELTRLLHLNAGKETVPEVLAGLGWSVTGTPAGWTPASTLYCGRIAAVGWDRNAYQPPDSDFPKKELITIKVGSSADEAAAATPGLAEAGDDAAWLLHMFAAGHLDTLDGPDGDILAAQDTHRSWFEQRPGGTVWRLVPTKATSGNAPRRTDEVTWSAAPLKAETLLADLNTKQSTLDEAERELRALQQRLYTLWWMYGRPLLPPQYTRDQFYREITEAGDGKNGAVECAHLAEEVARRQQQVNDLTGQVKAAADAITQQYSASPEGWELRSEALPSFWQVTDPTVVLGQTRGGTAHAALTASELLLCRTREQIPDRPLPDEFKALHLDNLPALVPDLLAEFVRALNGTADGGQAPEGLAFPSWRQPWKPLLYQWKIRYWHVPHTDKKTKTTNWELDDDAHYQWTSGQPDPDLERGDIIGRRFLVPLAQHKLAARARQYASDTRADENGRSLAAAFTAFADAVAQADVLSQKTDGLTDALACRDKAPNLSPPGRIGELVGDAFDHLPNAGPLPMPFEGWQPSGFTQIRAGQFMIAALSIVDEFGQSLDVVLEKDSNQLRPITASSLRANGRFVEDTNQDRFVQLPPRLLQPARVRFDFVNQKDKKQDVDLTAGTTPVGAWIVPNYVDQALLCYAANGEPLGEVCLRLDSVDDKPVQQVVAWAPLPDSAVHTLGDLQPDQPVLHGFVQELATKGTDAFMDLLKTIAHVLHGIDPGNPYGDDVLGTLLGRPLALARTRLGIELEGPPVSDPGWEHALDWQALTQWRQRVKDNHGRPPVEMAHLDYHWPVCLGNAGQLGDGLIGYFTEPNQTADDTDQAFTDYGTFYAVATDFTGGPSSGYVEQVSADNRHRLPADSTTHTYLTVLFDPQAAVHATTDLLPVTPLQLPSRFTRAALAAMQTALRLSPVLTAPRTIPDPTKKQDKTVFIDALALPHPTAAQGTWDWSELQSTEDNGKPVWHHEPLVQIDQTARLDEDHPTVRTGYLRLTGGFLD